MAKIYLDHSATTPVDKPVLARMLPYFSAVYGNASSIHAFGQQALLGVDQARAEVAARFGCAAGEVIFTSGATEANNLAIQGVFKALAADGFDGQRLGAVTSAVEHDAVLEPFKELAQAGAKVSYLPVGRSGAVEAKAVRTAIRPDTVLVSLMWANSETGTVMPVRAAAKAVADERARRAREWQKRPLAERPAKPLPIYFHTDATQAVNFYDCNIRDNFVDLLSFSGHKIYGPKGVGALIARGDVRIKAIQGGGHHERNLRSGTLNVPGIVGLGAAVAQLSPAQVARSNRRIGRLRDRLVDGLLAAVPDAILNTDRGVSTPAHAHFSFLGVEGEALLIALDLEGIAVSTGSACASGSLKASGVLLAMGIDKETAHYSIRFTLGKHNTAREIDAVIRKTPAIVGRLRQMNPLYKK